MVHFRAWSSKFWGIQHFRLPSTRHCQAHCVFISSRSRIWVLQARTFSIYLILFCNEAINSTPTRSSKPHLMADLQQLFRYRLTVVQHLRDAASSHDMKLSFSEFGRFGDFGNFAFEIYEFEMLLHVHFSILLAVKKRFKVKVVCR